MLSPSPTKEVVAPLHVSRAHPRRRKRIPRAFFAWTGAVAVILALGALLVIYPFQFPSAVSTFANITAAHEWSLVQGPTGQLITRTFNYQTGMSDGYALSNFPAGSSTFFTVAPSLRPGKHVAAGDTVGMISSSDVQERLVALNGQLAAAQASLTATSTGAKSAVVQAAQERLDSTIRRRAEYQSTLTRTQQLFDSNDLPQAQYDQILSTAHSMDDAVRIAKADLEAAQSGAKPEDLAVSEARIAQINNEIAALNSRAAGYTMRTPIAGVVSSNNSSSALLTVAATSSYVALIPIRWSDYARVSSTANAQVTLFGFSRPVLGHVVALGHEVQSVAQQKVVMATVFLDSPPPDLLQGSTARCRIDCNPMTALEYGRFIMNAMATSVNGAAN